MEPKRLERALRVVWGEGSRESSLLIALKEVEMAV